LSVLIETLSAFDRWLHSAGINPASKTSFWRRWWGGTPDRPPLDRGKVDNVRATIAGYIDELRGLLHSEDDAAVTSRTSASAKIGTEASIDAKSSVSAGAAEAAVSAGAKARQSREASRELTEASRRNKIDILHRRIIDFQSLFLNLVELSGSDAYIFLDDLYHIPRKDQ
jgi:hypothetical protein